MMEYSGHSRTRRCVPRLAAGFIPLGPGTVEWDRIETRRTVGRFSSRLVGKKGFDSSIQNVGLGTSS